MSDVILDSSAIMALINKEDGSDIVESMLYNSIISSVNLSEIASILIARLSMPKNEIMTTINELIKQVISFDYRQAYIIGEIEKINIQKKFGLSLRDKGCLSLGKLKKIPIYTADKIQKEVKIKDLELNLIW